MYRYEYAKNIHGKHKVKCPKCGSRGRFNLFWDNQEQKLVDAEYGKCDRVNSCGYENRPEGQTINHIKFEQPPMSTISKKEVQKSLEVRYKDPLSLFLLQNFKNAKKVLDDYVVASVYKWGEYAPLFWYVDDSGKVRSGKIMRYKGIPPKRTKHENYWDNVRWIHTDKEGFNYQQIAFGSHLIKKYPDKPVKIVESEKTALIMSCIRPQYNWLATLAYTGLQPHLLPNLKDKDVEVFPDKGQRTLDYWKIKVKEFLENNGKVSTFVEEQDELGEGDDIADFILLHLEDFKL